MFERAPKLALFVMRVIPHPQEKIWRALTEGPLIEQWLLKNDFQPVVGHRCQEVEEHAASFGWQRYMAELGRAAGGLD